MEIIKVIAEKAITIVSMTFSKDLYEPQNSIPEVTKLRMTTHQPGEKKGTKMFAASAAEPIIPPPPAKAGIAPKSRIQTAQEDFFWFIFVLGPGISEKLSKKVFLVTIMYLAISACTMDLLMVLNITHQRKAKPAAAPKRDVKTNSPLPTTLPTTITLGPTYFRRWMKVLGACIILENLY